MLLSRAKRGARGNAATKIVVKPNWRTERKTQTLLPKRAAAIKQYVENKFYAFKKYCGNCQKQRKTNQLKPATMGFG